MYINDGLIYRNFIKYDDLTFCFAFDANKFRNKPLTIFIDADTLYEAYMNVIAYNMLVDKEENCGIDRLHLSATLMNMIGHYKHYAMKSLFVTKVDVFVIANTLPVEIAQKIISYIPDVYIINNEYTFDYKQDSSSIIMICNELSNIDINTNTLVITSENYYCYQLPSIFPNCTVVKVNNKYYKAIKNINKTNNLYAFNYRIRSYDRIGLSADLIPLITAYNCSKQLSFPMAFNIKDTVKKMQEYIENAVILNGYNSVYSISNTLMKDTTVHNIMQRYMVADLRNMVSDYKKYPKDDLWKVKKYADISALSKVCDTYFNSKNNVVNLDYIVFG